MNHRTLVICDSAPLLGAFVRMKDALAESHEFEFACSPPDSSWAGELGKAVGLEVMVVGEVVSDLIARYDLILSLHCRQILPVTLVREIRCVNVHPGFLPYNRGWYPHCQGILAGLPVGATLHEIDERIDHGPIIDRAEVTVHAWDTSESVYERILGTEVELLENYLPSILRGDYETTLATKQGKYNSKADFERLCHLSLGERTTIGELIDRLRALTHGRHRNAWFRDKATGRRVFVRVDLEPEADDS